MTNIQILLLGRFEVRIEHQPVELPRLAAKDLLVYLAASGGVADKGWLAPWLPEDLCQALDDLNQLGQIVFEDSSFLRLTQNGLFIDQVEFQNLVDRAGRIVWQIPRWEALPEEYYRPLYQAAALWRGPEYIENYEMGVPALQEWLKQRQKEMNRLYIRILERLADHHFALSDPSSALNFSRLALKSAPLNEDLHERVLRALIDLEQQSEAVVYFDNLQKLFLKERGVPPGTRIVRQYARLHASLLRHEPKPAQPVWQPPLPTSISFVGRRAFLDEIYTQYRKGGSLLISGESGIGKTRLIQEFVRQTQPPRPFVGFCHPAEKAIPFQPVINALRYRVYADDWITLAPGWRAQLSLLLPELRRIDPGQEITPVELSTDNLPDPAREVLFEAIRQFMLLIAKQSPVLLCIEDLHWADESTLQAIHYLASRPPFENNGLLLLSARSEEINPDLQNWIAQMKSANDMQHLHLRLLTRDETAELAESIIGEQVGVPFGDILQKETGGNPLYIFESLRALLEINPEKHFKNPLQLPFSPSLKDTIRTRLKRLNPEIWDVAAASAVIGSEFDIDILMQVAGPAQKVLEAIKELESRALVERNLMVQGYRYGFVHYKIREALLDQIPPEKLQKIHRSVARALESTTRTVSENHAALLAEHYELGGELYQAFAYWLSASRRALQLLSIQDAIRSYQRAAAIISQVPNINEDQINILYHEWTETCYLNQDISSIEKINHELLSLAKERNSPYLIGTALNGLSDACLASGQFNQGLTYTGEAVTQLITADRPAELIEAYNRQGLFHYMLGHIPEALKTFQLALAVGGRKDNLRVVQAMADCHYQLATGMQLSGFPVEALRHARESLENYKELSRTSGMATALGAMSVARYYLGDLQQAQEDCQLAIQLGEQIQAWRRVGYLHTYRAMIALAKGDLEFAFQEAYTGIHLAEKFEHSETVAWGYQTIADLFLWLRWKEKAIEYAEKARQAGKNSFIGWTAYLRKGLALAFLQNEAGYQIIKEVQTVAKESSIALLELEALSSETVAQLSMGHPEVGVSILRNIGKELSNRKLFYLDQTSSLYLASYKILTGNVKEAVKEARASLKFGAKVNFIWIEMTARMVLYQAAVVIQDSKSAEREFQAIKKLISQLSAGIHSPELLEGISIFQQELANTLGRDLM